MNTTQVAVDLAKSVFEVAVSRRPGKVHETHRLSRNSFTGSSPSVSPSTS